MRNANGYGSIIKLSGKRRRPFAVRVTSGWSDDGKQIYKYLSYHASKPDAMIALAEYNKAPYDLDATNITLDELISRYNKDESHRFSDAMIKLNNTCYNHVKPLHNHAFRDLRKAHLQGVINDLETLTAKHNVASYFRKLFHFAMEHDIVNKDYSQFVTTPPKAVKGDKLPFNRDEINSLWNLVGNVNAEILLILAYSGMRVSELLLLEKTQINLAEQYIITGSKTEAGKDRYIPIHRRIMPLVEKHYQNGTQWLIANRFGDNRIRYDSFHAKRFKPLAKRLNLRSGLTPHSTRHFFISELHLHGADKIAVQRIVGHKSDNVTEQTYTHIDRSTLHDIVNLIE